MVLEKGLKVAIKIKEETIALELKMECPQQVLRWF
jgi:hypothetical protein